MKNVDVVRHALAIDEKRFMFVNNTSQSQGDNIQMWFAGVHADVGGGHPEPESGLAKIPLGWIMDEARKAGLKIDDKHFDRYVNGLGTDKYVQPDVLGKKHVNWMIWYVLNFIPRLRTLSYDPKKYKLFIPFLRRRIIQKEDQVHRSVFERMKQSGYNPKNVRIWQDKNKA